MKLQEVAIGVIIALLSYLAYLLKKYLESYASEKGKTAATKEDIQAVTKLVESVKIDFNEKIEHLRVNLLFQNTIKGIMYTDKKEAIIRLYESAQMWYETIENHLVSSIGYTLEGLSEAENDIAKQEFSLSVAEAKAELYVHDDDFFALLDDYCKLITPLETLTYHLMIDYGHIIRQFPHELQQNEEKKKINKERFALTKPLRSKILDKWSEFRDECFKKLSTP
jgi:hypothetical protein